MLPASSTPTSWPRSGARSTPTKRTGRGGRRDSVTGAHRMPARRSARSALARHRRRCDQAPQFEDPPVRGAARRSHAGAHRGAARSSRSRRVPVCRDMPRARVSRFPRTVGERSARMRSSAGSACTTYATRQPAKPSWRVKTYRRSASCSGTEGTGPQRATPTLPTGTS